MPRLLIVLAFAVGCGPCDEQPVGTREMPFATEQESPRCASDAECVVVSIHCSDPSAQHRSRAEAYRNEHEDLTAECQRAAWATMPERFDARCMEGRCQLERVVWPESAACETGDECVVLVDPCTGSVPVAAAHAEMLSAEIESEDRAALCASRNRPEPGPTTATCQRGYCRLVFD